MVKEVQISDAKEVEVPKKIGLFGLSITDPQDWITGKTMVISLFIFSFFVFFLFSFAYPSFSLTCYPLYKYIHTCTVHIHTHTCLYCSKRNALCIV